MIKTMDISQPLETIGMTWKEMMRIRSQINLGEAAYAKMMTDLNNENFVNPHTMVLKKYDEALLELQTVMTKEVIRLCKESEGQNVEVSDDNVFMRMIEHLTDGDSPTTIYGKPLVFSPFWVAGYLQENYFTSAQSANSSVETNTNK